MRTTLLLVLLAGVLAVAQVRSPVPVPGSPPIGRTPGDEQGRRVETTREKKDKKKKAGTKKEEQPTITAEGATLRNDGKELEMHTADGRWITMSVDSETKWVGGGNPIEAGRVQPGAVIKAEMAVADDYTLTALSVELVKAASAPDGKSAALPAATPDAKTIAASGGPAGQSDDVQLTSAEKPLDVPEAPGRPKLHRGKSNSIDASGDLAKPASEKKTVAKAAAKAPSDPDEYQEFSIGSDKPVRKASAGGPGSDVLQRTFSWAEDFNQGLPNYLCREVITRYAQETRSEDWKAQDVVTANVVYQDGVEQYRDVMVGNKKVSDMSKTGGTWSTGEFASMLHSLFQPTRDAEFTYHRTTNIHEKEAAVFDYGVALPNSDWSIIMGGQILRPPYSGTMWVDKATGIVHRIEREAKNIPKDFPMDQIQAAVEYDEISLGTKKFLLPVRSENIACQRGTTFCTRNVIEFRDYHKFSGESTIEFK